MPYGYPNGPLPPRADNMQLMTESHFDKLGPDSFKPLGDALEVRHTRMAEITGGAVGVSVFRAKAGAKGNGIPWHWHELGLHVSYVLKGWALYEFEGVGEVRVNAGDFMYQPPFNRHRELEQSEDFEAMEFTLPATFESMMMYYEPEKDSWRTEAVHI